MTRPKCPGLCHLVYPANDFWGPDYHSKECQAARAAEKAETEGRRMQRISRDEYGLNLARVASEMADCTRRKVGAVIVHPTTHQILAMGYNGLAAGKPGCLTAGACPRGQLSYTEQAADQGYEATGCRAIHAEVNAILWAGGRPACSGATMYVTDRPCFGCSVVIEGAGIARVVIPGREPGGYVPMELAL